MAINPTLPQAVSFGAEALSPQAEEAADDHGWRLAQHFKLHLHPSDMQAKHNLRLRRMYLFWIFVFLFMTRA